jgi:hypothetical protein
MKSAYFFLSSLLAVQAVFAGETEFYPLTLGTQTLNVELAVTAAEQEKGLMFRRHLGENQGMLFVFKRADRYCMWMKNTFVPLDVAFIDEGGTVINIESMQPQSENLHCSKGGALYAVEAAPQWFARAGLKAGSAIPGFTGTVQKYLSAK